MNTAPSKRELQHFLKRYVPQPELTASHLLSGSGNAARIPSNILSPQKYVDALLAPSAHQLAVTKVEGPFEKQGWDSVGSTLVKLQKLGLTSIVVSDNAQWFVETETPADLSKTMVRETMALVESIEKAGGRARLIHGGVLEQGTHGIEAQLDFIQSSLDNRQIPVVIPVMTSEAGRQQPITGNQVIIALTQKMVRRQSNNSPVPAKIVIINNDGGIVNHERPGTAHSLINVQEEYDSIVSAFDQNVEWQARYPTAVSNLDMIRTCLSDLPTSSSAVIVPTSSLPSALIANLVTDKPLYSSSLPNKDTRRVNKLRTTVLRHGIKIHNYDNVDDLDLERLTRLMESSFQKKLDQDGFYDRLRQVLAGAIIAGDYEGAVIMTKEQGGHYYLDKFAIAPTSQGIGLTDILWKRMCDAYPELLWRSRQDNGVNKWYFERSNGYLRLKDTNWVLFWYGAGGFRHIDSYASIARSIPASFTGPLIKI
ncbi:hypothetical protein BDB00DRAFT_857650 [Zychaea mexicana]|uniref:uncharacterized protein n=1 Tax=Zychaea mexicana TaxID=64656 RepID=UPI0022FDD690|nr:uncharacterized protein BDB00DRAFT_857650 [Zychaea mexicana]KAI9482515.1 hypothetical protein BDB00DRAFT_857650 [Zychaea mexicana]